MSEPASPITSDNLSIDGLFACCDEALASAQGVYDQARQRLSAAVTRDGRLDARLLDSHQFAAHGIAWVAHLCRGPAPDAELGQGARGVRHVRRA